MDRCKVSLRICGDNLDPDDLTRMMGISATVSHRKGDAIISRDGKHQRTAKRGIWSLEQEPNNANDDLETTITNLLSLLPSDVSVWSELATRFEIDLFCGLFLDAPNRGLTLSPKILRYLGERQIELGLDIYSPNLDTALESLQRRPENR